MTQTSVLGVRISPRTRQEALDRLADLLDEDRPHSVYFVHAATANLAFEDDAFREALNRADLVLHDGVGVRWAARRQGVDLAENLVGTDLVPMLFDREFGRPLRVYLLGGKPGVAERAAAAIETRVEVVGCRHGYFSEPEEQRVVDEINDARPDVLLVGMGNPRQEFFIDRRLRRLQCRLAIGVGGLFDHWSARLRRASPRFRRWGLEWLQLLAQQPHKWRRYLLGIPLFLWRAGIRRRLAGVALVFASVALALLAGEGVVRFVRPQILERYPPGLYVTSATRQYKLRPHFRGVFRYPEFQTTVEINGQGFRAHREYGPPRPGARRILAVGDSFTMGYSVGEERTWARMLESMLGSGYEVINGGVPGYSTWQELAFLEEEGFALRPDVVLLAFFIGNDVADNARSTLPVVLRDGRLLAENANIGPVRLAAARHSHLYTLAIRSRQAGRERLIPEAGWQATAALIARFARMCEERGVRPIVALIPERLQTEGDVRRMRELCRLAGVEAIDLLDALCEPGLYFPQDGHWNVRGNALAARAIFQYLSHDPT